MYHKNTLIKVYGHIWPIQAEISPALAQCLAEIEQENLSIDMEGNMVRISYEGRYFPLEDTLNTLIPFLHAQSQGKLDVIDLEAWELTRHTIDGTNIHTKTACLNTVMDYSGH